MLPSCKFCFRVVVVVIGIVFFSGFMLISIGMYLPLDYLFETTGMTTGQYYAADLVLSCLLDVLRLPFPIILYFIFVEAIGAAERLPEVDVSECPPSTNEPWSRT